MKRIGTLPFAFLAALLAAVVLAALPAAPARAQEQLTGTLAKVRESGTIAIGYRESSVPFSYLNARNEPIGYSIELCRALVTAIEDAVNRSLAIKWVPVTSDSRIDAVVSGQVDLECGSTTNNTARGKEVAFAINHFYTGTRLLVKKSSNIKNYADLAKKTIASTTGTTNVLVMRKYNIEKNLGMDIVLGKDHADAFLLLESDRVVAFAMDDILLYGLIANAKTPGDYEVVGDSLQVEPYACMLPKDDPAFKKLVDDTFAGLMKSGEFEKLYNKWFMQPIPPKNVPLNLPMSPQLKENLKALSDKPAT